MAFVEPTKFTWVVDENGKKRKKAARDTSWRARYIDPNGHARPPLGDYLCKKTAPRAPPSRLDRADGRI